MSLSEDPTKPADNQEASKPRTRTRRPRRRTCLLKGCGRVYPPDHPLQRYCSPACRQQAKKWYRWKAQQKYRTSESGKTKRKEQCRRRRRRQVGKTARKLSVRCARVIPIRFFPILAAIVLVATPGSQKVDALHCSVFARTIVGGHWNEFWSGSGGGESVVLKARAPERAF